MQAFTFENSTRWRFSHMHYRGSARFCSNLLSAVDHSTPSKIELSIYDGGHFHFGICYKVFWKASGFTMGPEKLETFLWLRWRNQMQSDHLAVLPFWQGLQVSDSATILFSLCKKNAFLGFKSSEKLRIDATKTTTW